MSNPIYENFLRQADQHFDKIATSHTKSFQCKQGCHACCEPQLTVLKLEANRIVTYLKDHPEIRKQIERIEQTNPHNGTRCAMLDADGKCSIYPVRPFICRSHGAPIAIAREDYYQIDVCPLNFTENPIEELGPEDFFILDDWNEQLLDCAENEERILLTLSGLFSAKSR